MRRKVLARHGSMEARTELALSTCLASAAQTLLVGFARTAWSLSSDFAVDERLAARRENLHSS
jgi:hypothetical protein